VGGARSSSTYKSTKPPAVSTPSKLLSKQLISVLALGQPMSPAAVDVTFPDAAGTLQLSGQLYRPDGPGPFPAVVALHGCGGIQPMHHRWAHTLQQWGYVVLLVDSFSPRGTTNICGSGLRVDPLYVRMPDAYAAQAYLARQPFVDRTRIAVMGWFPWRRDRTVRGRRHLSAAPQRGALQGRHCGISWVFTAAAAGECAPADPHR